MLTALEALQLLPHQVDNPQGLDMFSKANAEQGLQ